MRAVVGAGLLVLTGAAGCAEASSPSNGWAPGGDDSGIEVGEDTTAGAAEFTGSGGEGTEGAVQLELQPEHAVLDITHGVASDGIDFAVHRVGPDGDPQPVAAAWSFDRPDLATFEGSTLKATGLAGGHGTVTVETALGELSTSVQIVLHVVDRAENVPPEAEVAFGAAALPDPALDVLYPEDGTVFPRGLRGPTVMWDGGGPENVYRVSMQADTFDYVGYRVISPPGRFELPRLPADLWRVLNDSVTGELTVSVQRYDGVRAYLAEERTWTISSANLRGMIYYWQVNTGDVVRISPGDDVAEPFLQRKEGECVACHSVSRDGSTIVASRDGGASPWSLYDAASGTSLYETQQPSGFQAISPQGEFVVWRQWSPAPESPSSMVLSLADSVEPLATLEPPGGTPAHPTWSPDGRTVAFSVREDGNGIDFDHSTLWTAEVDTVTPGFSDLRQLALADGSRTVATYPTFSPDSAWIAFMRSTQSRIRGAQGELWMVNRDGTVQLLLDAAGGGEALSAADRHLSFEPTFSPVASGGYFWLVFVSTRPYGNLLTDPDPDTRAMQLWVTAIDAAPTPGVDPSHPAFWLPGQEPDNQNMRGHWALSPCRGLGASCEAGFECCEGHCVDDPDGGDGKVCAVPQGCARIDDACESDADCCDDTVTCTGGFCAEVFIP